MSRESFGLFGCLLGSNFVQVKYRHILFLLWKFADIRIIEFAAAKALASAQAR
jgi:hypothetical protein